MFLAAIADLERRFDGPVPERLKRAAMAGGAWQARRVEAARAAAAAEERFFQARARLAALRRLTVDAAAGALARGYETVIALHGEARRHRSVAHAERSSQS